MTQEKKHLNIKTLLFFNIGCQEKLKRRNTKCHGKYRKIKHSYFIFMCIQNEISESFG